MNAKDRLLMFLKHLNMGQNAFEKEAKISNGYISHNKGSFGSDIIANISTAYPDLNILWLITGEGSMLKTDTSSHSINQSGEGVPYYDVDFTLGFDLLENNQTVNPDYYINFPIYNKADCWVNATGRSMSPLIDHGDKIALKQILDWTENILYGETYALVTEDFRTIKKVRKSAKGDDYLRLIPENIEEYDEQDIPKSTIRGVFRVMGCAKMMY